MLVGVSMIPGVVEESLCRSSEDAFFTTIGDYKIHSNSLMPNIPFERAHTMVQSIDRSIFINEEPLTFKDQVKTQNYLTTKYIGRAPLTHYGPKTPFGHEFVLVCEHGDPGYEYRFFGTQAAIRGYNPSAGALVTQPR